MTASRLYLAQLLATRSADVRRAAVPSEAFDGGERDIYRAIRAVSNASERVTVEAVIAELREVGRLDKAGGFDAVDALSELTGTHTLDGARVELVADATKRLLMEAGKASHSLARDGKTREASEYMQGALRVMQAMSGAGKAVTLKSERQHVTDWATKKLHATEAEDDIPLGALATALGTVWPGAMGLIYGFSQTGKSHMMQYMELRYVQAGYPTLRISCEDPEHVIAGRLVSERSGVNAMQNGALTRDECNKVLRAVGAADHTWDERFVVEHGADVDGICQTMRTAAVECGVKVVFVDYAQILRVAISGREDSQEQRISHATAMLKETAKECGQMLWLGSQVTVRDPKPGKVYKPSPFDLKGARSLYEAAECGIAIWNGTDGNRFCEVQKNKLTGHMPMARLHVGVGGVIRDLHEIKEEPRQTQRRGYSGGYGQEQYRDD